MKFNKITIIGIGLLGGSLGLAIKKSKLAKEVCGVCRSQQSINDAKKLGIIDFGTASLEEGVINADIIILAQPVNIIIECISQLAQLELPEQVIITDVGSTKSHIVNIAEEKLKCFIGSHPMAGSEKQGMFFASADLFNDKLCFVTQTQKTDKAKLKKIINFWESLGANACIISPGEHDKYVAEISHLPHVIAACLVNSVSEESLEYASTGFLDTTRIAGGASSLWRDICLTNADNILNCLENFSEQINEFKQALKDKDNDKIAHLLELAKEERDLLR